MNEQQLLQSALNEINSLRKQNELMAARLDVFDNMMRLFHTTPNFGSNGLMNPDITYEISKYLETKK
jgi:hypothetical protein